MSLVYKGDTVVIHCTDSAGQQGARGVVESVNYASSNRFHVGVRLEQHPTEVHWHETACLEVAERAAEEKP